MPPREQELHLAAPLGQTADFAAGSIFFVGTATVILRYAGFTILTDPNFLHAGDHVHLGYGLTTERLTNPALDIEQLPPLDLCILSHLHGDHFDRIAEQRLNKHLPIVTTLHAGSALARKGFVSPIGLDTWDRVVVRKRDAALRITATPARHGPAGLHYLLPPVMGSVLEFLPPGGGTALRLYITGDTILTDQLASIPQRYPDIDLMLLHLGGARVLGVLLSMDAAQGVAAVRIIRPRRTIPIHYNDYTVFKSPLDDFKRAVTAAGLDDRVSYLSHGETYEFRVEAERWAANEASAT